VAVSEYERLSSEYNDLYQTYTDMRDELQERQVLYQERVSAYQQTSEELTQDIAYWNDRGGAPADEYHALMVRQNALAQESRELNTAQQELQDSLVQLNTTRDKVTYTLSQVNELVPIINTLAQKLEYNVDSYNTIQDSRGEFVTGTYAHQKGLSEITVYQFDSYDDLVLVLAHEMGHALGLDHTSDPSSIMYPFIDKQQHALSFDDIGLFRTTCSR
jgi:chromosome segregation ATPase